MIWLMVVWCAVLTVFAALTFWALLRHRKYFLQLEDARQKDMARMQCLSRLLINAGLREQARRLRRKWSQEAPFGDEKLQKNCLEFLDSLESDGEPGATDPKGR